MRALIVAAFSIGALWFAGCVQRPPEIKSPMTATDPTTAQCSWSDGIDPNGNPSCSDGCTWDPAAKRCAPTLPPKKVDVPVNGA